MGQVYMIWSGLRYLFVSCLLSVWVTQTLSANSWELAEQTSSEGTPKLLKKIATNHLGKRVTLNLCAFSTKDYTLKVIDQGNDPEARKYSNLRDAMEQNGCIAGLNGGFFGADFKPLGGVWQDGKQVHPYYSSARKGLASGVIWSGTGGIHIVRREHFKANSGVKQGIQTGPMLISNGATVSGLSTERPRPRSFVLTDWKGNWMLGTSSSVTLAELSEILDSTKVFPGMTINRAINLDGGRSTAFYLKQDNNKVTYQSEWTRVRNFLGIVPKSR